MNIYLFLSLAFVFTFLVGRLIEKLKIPWIFAALLFGLFFSLNSSFKVMVDGEVFTFLAQLGMYFLLFMIGLEIDLEKLKKSTFFIIKSTFFIVFLEAFFGSLLFHFVFDYSWLISFIVSLSFATVGEAILIPILDEFKLVNKKLGQSIIGIGTLDNIIELLALVMVIFIIGTNASYSHLNIGMILILLFVLFFLTYIISSFKDKTQRFLHYPIEMIFLFSIFLLFLYLGIGEYTEATPISALLAGIAIKNFIPQNRLKAIESEVKTISYGFFAPIFFIWVGAGIDVSYLLASPFLILLIVFVSKSSKLLGSYIVAKNELGRKESILLGIGLSVRFSTSIVIVKILYENGIIDSNLYSLIIASSIAFKFIVPVLFSRLIIKWKIA